MTMYFSFLLFLLFVILMSSILLFHELATAVCKLFINLFSCDMGYTYSLFSPCSMIWTEVMKKRKYFTGHLGVRNKINITILPVSLLVYILTFKPLNIKIEEEKKAIHSYKEINNGQLIQLPHLLRENDTHQPKL